MKQTIITSAVTSVVIVLLAVFAFPSTKVTERITQVSAVPGSDFSMPVVMRDSVTVGGYTLATSSRGAVTYTAANIAKPNLIQHIAEAATTATLPTNTALSATGFLPNIGDTKVVYLQASTTAITLAGNTGVTLLTASTTRNIVPGSTARLTFIRLGVTEGKLIHVWMDN